jgi:hypothetical protein
MFWRLFSTAQGDRECISIACIISASSCLKKVCRNCARERSSTLILSSCQGFQVRIPQYGHKEELEKACHKLRLILGISSSQTYVPRLVSFLQNCVPAVLELFRRSGDLLVSGVPLRKAQLDNFNEALLWVRRVWIYCERGTLCRANIAFPPPDELVGQCKQQIDLLHKLRLCLLLARPRELAAQRPSCVPPLSQSVPPPGLSALGVCPPGISSRTIFDTLSPDLRRSPPLGTVS